MEQSLTKNEGGVDIVEKRLAPFGKHVALKVWNLFTGLGLVLPLIFFSYDRSTNTYDEDNNEANESYRKWRECNDEGGTWYKYWCSNNNDDENGNDQQDDEEVYAPWWWRVRSDNEEHEDRYIVLTVLYFWTLIIVAGLIYFVNQHYRAGKLKSVRWFLIGWVVYASTIILLLGGIPQLIIEEVYDDEGDGEQLQEHGWYGQTSVLTFTTCVYEMVTCIGLICWIVYTLKNQQVNLQKEDTVDHPYSFF